MQAFRLRKVIAVTLAETRFAGGSRWVTQLSMRRNDG